MSFIRSLCAAHISLPNDGKELCLRTIDTIYIDGAFVTPHGDDRALLFNPATEKQIGESSWRRR
jgi:hypothetical protein